MFVQQSTVLAALVDTSLLLGKSLVSLLSDGELETLASGQGDVGLVTLTNNEDISQTGGEGVTVGILDVDNIIGSGMLLPVDDGTDPASVTATSDHAQVAHSEGDDILDLAGGKIKLDGVIGLDDGIRVPDGSSIPSVKVRNSLGSKLQLGDFAELVLCLGGGDPVHGEPALHIIDDSEVLSGLLQLDNIHEAGGELVVGPNLIVNLDQTLLQNIFDLL